MTRENQPEPIPTPLIDPDTGSPAVKYGDLTCTDDITLGYLPDGEPIEISLVEAGNGVITGAVGSGKTNAMTSLLAHATLMKDVQIVLLDPRGELTSPFFKTADVVADAPTLPQALEVLAMVRTEVELRRDWLENTHFAGIEFDAEQPLILVAIDEVAAFTADRDKAAAARFTNTLRWLMEFGLSAGIRVWVSGQRIDRDLLGSVDTWIVHRVDTPHDFDALFRGQQPADNEITAADRDMVPGEAVVSTPNTPQLQRIRGPRVSGDDAWIISLSVLDQGGPVRPQLLTITPEFDRWKPDADLDPGSVPDPVTRRESRWVAPVVVAVAVGVVAWWRRSRRRKRLRSQG